MSGIECSCAMDVYGDEGDYVFPERQVRARKAYNCVECGCQILVGELHQVLTGVFGGGFWNGFWKARTCITCSRIRDTYCRAGWVIGKLREHLKSCLGIDYVTGEFTKWAEKEDSDC